MQVRPVAIRTIVLKVASRCNLDCSYCYEFNRGDASWRDKPRFLSTDLARSLGHRIREFAQANSIARFNVNFHGGEPMLLGPARINDLAEVIRSAANPVLIDFGMQSNATLVNSEMLDVLSQHRIKVGASLDGDPEANRFRVDHRGEASWNAAAHGIRQLKARGLLAGIQAVIDLDSDPVKILRELCAFGPTMIELGQPFGTHDNPPAVASSRYSLGVWLCRAFDAWIEDSDLSSVPIRVLADGIEAVVFERSRSEWFPSVPPGYLIVSADGEYEGLDALKVVGSEGRVLGLNVVSASINDALLHPSIAVRAGNSQLCSVCRDCAISTWCAGGFYPTRFGKGNGYMNPSIYCNDLKFFFVHVGHWLARQPEIAESDRHRILGRLGQLRWAEPLSLPAAASGPMGNLAVLTREGVELQITTERIRDEDRA